MSNLKAEASFHTRHNSPVVLVRGHAVWEQDVMVSRARNRFYVVGSRSTWGHARQRQAVMLALRHKLELPELL